jgi:hypothetical protein
LEEVNGGAKMWKWQIQKLRIKQGEDDTNLDGNESAVEGGDAIIYAKRRRRQ